MSNVCSNCGAANPEGFKFCGQCGTPFTAAPPAPDTRPDAERRHITILFCDLVDSTALSERMDPEEFRDVVRDYQSACTEVTDRYGGYVAQHLGDGLMVYFGYPQAHEDDAQRAVHAGLGMVGAVRELNARLRTEKNVELEIRVGMHAGPVVAGEVGAGERREQLALGRAPNVAARVQGQAEPNSVVLSDAVHQLVQGFFACDSMGTVSLKGVSEPMAIHRVLHSSGVRSRFEVAVSEGLSPLVGRHRELEALQSRFDFAASGAQLVTVSGEPGMGKSRLVQLVRELADTRDCTWLIGRSSPFYANSPFNPLIDLLQRAFRFEPHDSPEEKLEKVGQAVDALDMDRAEAAPLLAELLALPMGEHALGLNPQRQKELLLDTLFDSLVRMSNQRPVVFVIEDLHWTDPSTLEFLKRLAGEGGSPRIFTLLTFRPTFEPPWDAAQHHYDIRLDPLTDQEVRDLVTGIAGGKKLPADVLDKIVEKTDGVPIFVEELTKMILESELLEAANGEYRLAGEMPVLAIPTTLQDSLMARLDRMTDARDVALLAAVLGREFTFELIQAVSQRDPAELEERLGRLVDAQLLYQRGTRPSARYVFKHALIQDSAYGLLLKSTRQKYHRQSADTLRQRFPDVGQQHPELIAHHYAEAGMPEPAVNYWILAGRRGIQRYANAEVLGHVSKGLEFLQRLEASAARDEQELALQTMLGTALIASKGYGAPEVKSAYARALEICGQMGETPQLFLTLNGLWMFHVVSGQFSAALELSLRLVELADSLGDAALLVEAHYAVGNTRFYLGEFAAAREHFEKALEPHVEDPSVWNRFPTGDDPRIHALCFLALALWHLGFPEMAQERSRQAMELAKENGHPHGEAFAKILTAWLSQFLGDPAGVQQHARAGLAVAEEKGFPYWRIHGHFLLGWCRTAGAGCGPEETAEALVHMTKTLEAMRASGARVGQTLMLSKLVSSYAGAGMVPEGMATLDEAMQSIESTGERSWEAEFHRLRGELTALDDSSSTSAEDSLRRALDVARDQGAKSLELRAALSLGRFWARHGRRADAADLIQGVYDSFTEGRETADLSAAQALLDELS